MKCSEYVKERGVKSLSLLSELSGVQIRTLQNWYEERRFVFDAIVEKVKPSSWDLSKTGVVRSVSPVMVVVKDKVNHEWQQRRELLEIIYDDYTKYFLVDGGDKWLFAEQTDETEIATEWDDLMENAI
jgi:hypothetical protein